MSNATLETMPELLDLVGIKRVIWIDDKFDVPSDEQANTGGELISRVAYLKAVEQLPDHELFVSLRSNSDQDERLWFESEIQGDATKFRIAANLVNGVWGALEHEAAEAMVPELSAAMVTSGGDDAGSVSTFNPRSADVAREGEEKEAADAPHVLSSQQQQPAGVKSEVGSVKAEGDTPPPAAERRTGEASERRRSEYKDADVNAIKEALGARLQTHGLKSWRAAKRDILSSIDDGTLFLIDLEFKVDGVSSPEGKDIASSVLNCADGRGIVIVLTHSTSAEDAQAFQAKTAQEMVNDYQLAESTSERLMVIAKQTGASEGETAVDNLRWWLRVSFTLQTCFDFVDGMAKEMKKEIDEAQKTIRRQSVYNLDEAVFQSSLKEGALEFDVLSRMLLGRQRVAAERFLGKERSHIDALARLRRLRQGVTAPPPQASVRMLGEWYRDEVFVMGEPINRAHAPLACGDMFEAELKNHEKRRFVLLAQPCDISVRAQGTRKFEEAIFVEVIKKAPESSKGGSAPMMFDIPSFEGDGVEYLSFRCWGSVNLRCLDFAVFNSSGAVRFDREQSKDVENALLPGWAVRLKAAKAQMYSAPRKASAAEADDAKGDAESDVKDEVGEAAFQIPTAYRLLSLSSNVPEAEGQVHSDGSLVFLYKRIGRLRAQRAVAAYAAFSSYQTRGAFEHDFSGVTQQKQPKGTEGKPPGQKKPQSADRKQQDTGGKPRGREGRGGDAKAIEKKPKGDI